MTYSEFYWEDFAKGMPVKPHHGPTRGGDDEDNKFIDWYAKTLESYEQIFGNKPPYTFGQARMNDFEQISHGLGLTHPSILLLTEMLVMFTSCL